MPTVRKVEFISRRMAAMAATQGVYRSVNTRKLTADSGVNRLLMAPETPAALVPSSTLKVDTTASLAVMPVTRAVEILQSEKPSGPKIGASHCPIMARRLWALSVATLRRASNVWRNQMMMVATKMIVNALSMKSRAFSHMSSSTLLSDGKR